MTRNIDILDRYTIQFYKPIWNDNEIELAACLNIKQSGVMYLCDIRTTNKVALFEFLKACFPSVMLSNASVHFRNQLFPRLKIMYSDLYNEFLNNHYPALGYEREMFKHQKEALAQMMYRKVTLLAFEQGLGKTLASASISKLLKINRTIIVSPTIVKWNWLEDMTKEWGYDSLLWTILDAKKSKCLHAFMTERFVVVNYEMIEKHFDYLIKSKVGHIIFDECHKIKNTSTKRFRHSFNLVKQFPEARISLLSGTPYTNRIIDMYAYLKIAGHPLGKSLTGFKKKYARSSGSGNRVKVIGAKNVDDLRIKLSNFMIRRKAEECLDLPDLLIKNYYFDIGELDTEYNQKMDELPLLKQEIDNLTVEIDTLTQEDPNEVHAIRLSSLRKERSQKKIAMTGNIHTLNRLATESKVDSMITLIDSLWEQGKKVIVFAGYTNALQMLQKHYKQRCILINGSVDSHKRQGLINKFKSDPNCHVFLGNMKAAGIGINVVNSHHVIFMNFPFTPDDLEQSYKRTHRPGQKEKVYVYYTIGRGTIDEHVYDIIKDKAKDINALIDDNKNVIHYNSLESQLFKSLIAEYNKKKGIVTEDATGFVSVK